MDKKEASEFATYVVYEEIETGTHYLGVFKELFIAKMFASHLAKTDKKGDPYFVGLIEVPNTWVPGGGWWIEYQMKDGRLSYKEVG